MNNSFYAGYYNIPESIAKAYWDYLKLHIECVQAACIKLGVDEKQASEHDASKFLPLEFVGYATHFYGGGAPDAFATAWLHHIHANPHHWNHFIFPGGYTPKGSTVEKGVVYMPVQYSKEMVADWMGASKALTGSWHIGQWLIKNIPTISVHSQTAAELRGHLESVGYKDTMAGLKFSNELTFDNGPGYDADHA